MRFQLAHSVAIPATLLIPFAESSVSIPSQSISEGGYTSTALCGAEYLVWMLIDVPVLAVSFLVTLGSWLCLLVLRWQAIRLPTALMVLVGAVNVGCVYSVVWTSPQIYIGAWIWLIGLSHVSASHVYHARNPSAEATGHRQRQGGRSSSRPV